MDFDDFDDVSVMARVLVDLGCREASVTAILAEQFPGADVEAEYDEALLCLLDRKIELQLQRRREAAAAVASEHDLSRSMHDVTRAATGRRSPS